MRSPGFRPLAAVLIALLVALPTACDEGIAPDRPLMVYVLRSIDGDALPARPTSPSNHEVIADTLFFDADGTGVERRVIRNDEVGSLQTGTMTFTWSRRGARLDMWGWCLGNGIAGCPPGPTLGGSVDGATWVVVDSDRYRTPSLFRRID